MTAGKILAASLAEIKERVCVCVCSFSIRSNHKALMWRWSLITGTIVGRRVEEKHSARAEGKHINNSHLVQVMASPTATWRLSMKQSAAEETHWGSPWVRRVPSHPAVVPPDRPTTPNRPDNNIRENVMPTSQPFKLFQMWTNTATYRQAAVLIRGG